jgi:hypothetical protein
MTGCRRRRRGSPDCGTGELHQNSTLSEESWAPRSEALEVPIPLDGEAKFPADGVEFREAHIAKLGTAQA